MKKHKISIKEIIDEIYQEGLIPNNRRDWVKAMEGFFTQLKEEMKSPEVGNIMLTNFASIKVKPLASMHAINNEANIMEKADKWDYNMLEGLAKKTVLIIKIYEQKVNRQRTARALPKSIETIKQLRERLDERFGEAAWWADSSVAIRDAIGRIEDANRSKTAAINGDGNSMHRE